MHIALVTETYPPEVNGVALTVQALAQGLAEAGHRVEVVRPRQPGVAAEASARMATVTVAGAALPRYPGLRFGLPAGGLLRRRWRQQRPDAVYVATEGPLGLSALRAARRLGIAACTGFHTRFDDFVRHYGAGWLTPLVFAWLRRFHGRADATLVPTDELRQFLQSHGFGRVHLLRRAVDTQLFHPGRRDPHLRAQWQATADTPVMVYVGRIAPEKNLDLAVRAFRAIQREQPGARYVWVGDGPARAALQAAHPDFLFVGTQHGEALARHYASADLFLFPSLTETFGNVTLEAMACGLATVAYDYGAAREHIDDGISGRRIARDDADGFVLAARQLAREPHLRAALGGAARDAVLPLQPPSVITAFAHLLEQLRQEKRHDNPAALAST